MENGFFKDLPLGAFFNKICPDFIGEIMYVKVSPWHCCEITSDGFSPRVMRFDHDQLVKPIRYWEQNK